MRSPTRWLLGLGLVWSLVACGPRATVRTTPALASPAPSPTAEAAPTPLPASPSPARAATATAPPSPTTPWTQHGPWPTPSAPLALQVQVDPAWDPEAMRAVLATLLDADEIWAATVPAAWPGPRLPDQAQVLLTAHQPDRDRWWVDFLLAPEDWPALQQAVAGAGWAAFPNINPDLAQLAPGLVLLEFHPQANAGDATLTVLVLRVQEDPRLWLRMAWWGHDAVSAADATPQGLPWGLPVPAGWQVAPPTSVFDAAGLQAMLFPVDWGATPAEDALAAWDAALQAQGWQPAGREVGSTVLAAAWSRGEERRALVLAQVPGHAHDGVLLTEAFALTASPSERPRWHGDLPPDAAQQAAILAAVLWNPQLPPSLTLSFGSEPPANAPWAAQTRQVLLRRSDRETALWVHPNAAPWEALAREGWSWLPPGGSPWAVALWGAPWPDPAGPGRAARWLGGLCRDDAGWLAYGGPDGWWTLFAAGPCPADTPPAGVLPWPEGFPERAYAAVQTQVVEYDTGLARSLAAFWLPSPTEQSAAWLAQATQAATAASWTVESLTPRTRLLRVPLGQGDGQAVVGAWPLLEGQTLFFVLANR